MLVRDDLISTGIDKAKEINSGTDVSWTRRKTKAKDVIIGSFYMLKRRIDFLDRLDASLQKIIGKGEKNVILCGDFNCPDVDRNSHTVPARAPDRQVQEKLVEMAEKHGLHQIHDQPTRGENLLDLVFTTNPTLFKASISIPGLSDHDMVLSDFCIRPFQVKKPPRKCLLFNRANWDEMRRAATEISEQIVSQDKNGADVNALWETFRNQLPEATEKHIPSVLRSSRHRLP